MDDSIPVESSPSHVAPVPVKPKSSFFKSYPTLSRTLIILGWTVVAICVSLLLNVVANAQMAAGAAITISVLGLSWLTGHSGQISIGNSGFVMVGGYAAALWESHHGPNSVFGMATGPGWLTLVISLVLAVAVGALTGLIIGLPGTRLRGPYLAGFTLAFAVVMPSFISTLSSLGGTGGVTVNPLVPPGWFSTFFSHFEGGPYYQQNANASWTTVIVILVASSAFFFMANLFHSKTGRSMRLVRDNDVAAELVGVHLARTRTLAFVISAAYGGLCGGLIAYINQSVQSNTTFPFTLSITILTIMVLGGMGTLSGAVIAGIIYAFSGTLISHLNTATGINPTSNLGVNMQGIIFGGILILTMLLAPRGIAGLSQHLRQLLVRTPKKPEEKLAS